MSENAQQDPQDTAVASTVTEVKSTTTYVVLHEGHGDNKDWFAEIGRYVVPVGRSDKAKEQALADLARKFPETTHHNVVAVPEKSWQPEAFTLEQPEPRFKKAA